LEGSAAPTATGPYPPKEVGSACLAGFATAFQELIERHFDAAERDARLEEWIAAWEAML
jgi:hypothetical protein